MKPLRQAVLCAFLIAFVPLVASSQAPRLLSYQGVLTNASTGDPVSDGAYAITFRLYDVIGGGTALWTETKSVQVTGGLFSTYLGDTTPFGATLAFDKPYWLGIQPGAEPELVPRTQLASAAYSQNSLKADTARFAQASASDGHWEDAGSDIYRMSGNVGIGTSSPLRKLEVAGTILADSLVYTTPRTCYLSVPSEAFLPWNDTPYVNAGGNGGAYISTAVSAQMNAAISLPQGAVITNVEWFFYDNSAQNLSCSVYHQSFAGAYSSIASGASSGTPGYGSVSATANHTVDNRTRGYKVQFYANPWDGFNLRAKGVLVTYTVRGPE